MTATVSSLAVKTPQPLTFEEQVRLFSRLAHEWTGESPSAVASLFLAHRDAALSEMAGAS